MRTKDIFTTKAKTLKESFEKTFGQKLKLETFSVSQLEDARNRLRTQIHQVRNNGNFNETIENEAYTKAQWMLDSINAELAERFEDTAVHPAEVSEGDGSESEIMRQIVSGRLEAYDVMNYPEGEAQEDASKVLHQLYDEVAQDSGLHPDDDFEEILDRVVDRLEADYGDDEGYDDEGGETDDAYALASAGHGGDEDYGSYEESQVREGSAHGYNVVKWYEKWGDQIKLIKWLKKEAGLPKSVDIYFDDADLVYDTETIVPNALADTSLKLNDLLTAVIKATGSGNVKVYRDNVYRDEKTGESMKQFRESAADKAGAVVVAKDMTDKVGRWIEELSGMENDQLISLGDTIRDEMGQDAAKAYLEAVAPAIQQALQNLKQTREILASGMRQLTGEEQSAEIIGSEPAEGDMAPVEPDEMNPEAGAEMPAEPAADEFAAAEPAAGGLEQAGREKRESIERQNSLLKILAG